MKSNNLANKQSRKNGFLHTSLFKYYANKEVKKLNDKDLMQLYKECIKYLADEDFRLYAKDEIEIIKAYCKKYIEKRGLL